MKSLLFILLTWGLIHGAGNITTNVMAAEKDATDDAIKTPSDNPKPRAIPFRGKIDKVDLENKTITVGKRMFHLTADTKIMKDGQRAKLSDAGIGESIGGAYLKLADNKLVAVSVRFGEKPAAKSKDSKEEDEKEKDE